MWFKSRSNSAVLACLGRVTLSRVACLYLVLVLAGCSGQTAPAAVEPTRPVPAQTVAAAPTNVAPTASSRVPLVVFAAGSLIIPFDALEKAFEQQYPHIDVRAEYHGSIQVIRHTTELHDEIDVVATADASLVPMLMYAVTVPETGQPYAEWTIRFATNRLALAHTTGSMYADEIDADNWTQVVTRPDVRMGLSDPRFDALGYRALMCFAMAQEFYGQPTLFRTMFGERFTSPITLFWDDDLGTITVPEIVETRTNSGLIMRGASIQLVALLQSGDLDYAFEYESVIRQHGLEMVSLPDELNLSVAELESSYSRVQVNLDFRRFASIKPQFRGERIGYGITIPSNALHPEEAALFIAFLLSPEGRAVMETNHHPLFDPPVADHYDRVPTPLQSLCVPGGTP
ncbi:MAG: tungstate ABC transporter substrate-binding protein WtpA [Anaerolineae bacterium]|nr:tungstate ABC transporter substrate-binding protein WtpA [Anaerolineae bacterium]